MERNSNPGAAILCKKEMDEELSEEIRFHFEKALEKCENAGASASEAQRMGASTMQKRNAAKRVA